MFGWRMRSGSRTVNSVVVGRRADGAPLALPLQGSHLLIGGLSGTGKTSTLRAVIVGACRRPDVALIGIDPKRIELRTFGPRLSALAVDPAEITETLSRVVALMEHRYRVLEAKRKVDWSTSLGPLVVVVIDELAAVVASGDSETDRTNARLLRQLLERGRAAGICLIAATQRPSAAVIPTEVRDLFLLRLAHATANADTTKMILGDNPAAGPAHELPIGPGNQGLCYVLAEGDRIPALARTFYVTPVQAAQVAERTAGLKPALQALKTPLPDPLTAPWPAPHQPTPKEAPSPCGESATADRPNRYDEDTEAVIVALQGASRPLNAAELQALTKLSEGRCRRARQQLEQTGRVLRRGKVWSLR